MKCHREPVEVFESTFTFEKSSDKGFKEKAAPKEACSDGATIMERKRREGGENKAGELLQLLLVRLAGRKSLQHDC